MVFVPAGTGSLSYALLFLFLYPAQIHNDGCTPTPYYLGNDLNNNCMPYCLVFYASMAAEFCLPD